MDVPLVGRDTPNENEQRVLGGFLAESPCSTDAIDLLQTEVPVGCQRVADAFDDVIYTDRSISTVLAPRIYTDLPEGFLNKKRTISAVRFADGLMYSQSGCSRRY